MGVSEAFLANTKNFDTIIGVLATCNAPVINTDLIQQLGYTDPNDLLVVGLIKDLKIINDDGSPGPYFDEFKNPGTTKYALSRGLLKAYEQLFKNNPSIHYSPPKKVKETFDKIFSGKKTDLIIKYMARTFICVVNYCAPSTIDAVKQNQKLKQAPETLSAVHTNGNGFIESKKITHEVTGSKTIDDLVKNFHSPIKPGEDIEAFLGDHHEESKEKTAAANDNFDKDDDPFGLNTPLPLANSKNRISNGRVSRRQFIRKALFRKSELLYKMQRWEHLLPTLEEIIQKYDNDEQQDVREKVARSIIHRAIVLLKLNRLKEALPALDSVIDHFKNATNKEFYHKATMVMIYKTQILEQQGEADLLPLYDSIIERIDANAGGRMKEKLDQIYLKRFDLISNLGDPQRMLEASSTLIARFKNGNQHSEYLQKAMIHRAQILDGMNRDEDALKAYDEFLAAFK